MGTTHDASTKYTVARSILSTVTSGSTAVSVEDADIPADDRAVANNLPNPFSDGTTIVFETPADAVVAVKIYDVHGREVETLVDRFLARGTHTVEWTTEGASSGVYFARVQFGQATNTILMVLRR